MSEELDRARLDFEKQKAADDLALERDRLADEKAKTAASNQFSGRNFGVLITAATTILGICLTAGQAWVARIQSDRESARRSYEASVAQTEKNREFDFQESKDLREFVIQHYSEITSSKDDVRNNIRDLMLSTYRSEVVTPVVTRLRSLAPKGQQTTWDQARTTLSSLAAHQPDTAWCYQEKKPSGTFGVYCHSSQSNCNTAKQGSRTATSCAQVTGLSQAADWHPSGKGLMGSWYQEGMVDPLPPPFPQP